MNNTNSFTIGALVIAILVIGVIGFTVRKPVVNVTTEYPLGANPGSEFTNTMIFHDGIMDGASIRATSTTDTTATFLASDIIDRSIVNFTPNVTGITATLPATTTLRNFIKSDGASHSLFLCNASTTALGSFTLAAGAGMNLHQATSTLVIEPADCAKLTFIRNTGTAYGIEVFYELGY